MVRYLRTGLITRQLALRKKRRGRRNLRLTFLSLLFVVVSVSCTEHRDHTVCAERCGTSMEYISARRYGKFRNLHSSSAMSCQLLVFLCPASSFSRMNTCIPHRIRHIWRFKRNPSLAITSIRLNSLQLGERRTCHTNYLVSCTNSVPSK